MTKWWNFGIYRFVIVVISGFVYCILHVCGGDPIFPDFFLTIFGYSPRMWRWSSVTSSWRKCYQVFSTYVEVILTVVPRSVFCLSYSPRMWRWSYMAKSLAIGDQVFSTYVEVILPTFSRKSLISCILHVCGGDPTNHGTRKGADTVFSTYVEVILTKLDLTSIKGQYSPRMWRWSRHFFRAIIFISVFSTYVEVILLLLPQSFLIFSILHVCGGDPTIKASNSLKSLYSPRMWRWSW